MCGVIMEERYEIKGYHGTSRQQGENILKTQHFLFSCKENEWLGKGAYFFAYLQDAVEWTKHNRFSRKDTMIMSAQLSCDDEEHLDLDNPEIYEFFQEAINQIMESVHLEESFDLHSLTKEERMCLYCDILQDYYPEIKIRSYTFQKQMKRNPFPYARNQKQICVVGKGVVSQIKEVTYVKFERYSRPY